MSVTVSFILYRFNLGDGKSHCETTKALQVYKSYRGFVAQFMISGGICLNVFCLNANVIYAPRVSLSYRLRITFKSRT